MGWIIFSDIGDINEIVSQLFLDKYAPLDENHWINALAKEFKMSSSEFLAKFCVDKKLRVDKQIPYEKHNNIINNLSTIIQELNI